jgi:hypothetical protein
LGTDWPGDNVGEPAGALADPLSVVDAEVESVGGFEAFASEPELEQPERTRAMSADALAAPMTSGFRDRS